MKIKCGILTLIISFVFLFVLTGCNNNQEPIEDKPTPIKVDVVIGLDELESDNFTVEILYVSDYGTLYSKLSEYFGKTYEEYQFECWEINDNYYYDEDSFNQLFITTNCTITGNWGPIYVEPELKITYFKYAYGSKWIENLVSRFEKSTGHKVQLIPSSEGYCNSVYCIQQEHNLSDIYIGDLDGYIENLYLSGRIEDLSDVFNKTVQTSNGEVMIKDYMNPLIIGDCYYSSKISVDEYKPYKMPLALSSYAMAYNEDVLKEIKHVSNIDVSDGIIDSVTNKWVNAPKTVNDLLAFFEDVVAFNNNSAEKQALGTTYNYIPFGYASYTDSSALTLIFNWWAEYQGLSTSKINDEGSFYDFFNFGNTTESNTGQLLDLNVYNQSGLQNAYNTFYELFVDSSSRLKSIIKDYGNSLDLIRSFGSNRDTQDKPVIIMASSYLEQYGLNNMNLLDNDLDGVVDTNYKFMNVPTLNEDSENLLLINTDIEMIIPSASTNKEVAKEFLVFMCSEEEIINFAKDTNGSLRPFNCDIREESNYSSYVDSVLDVYYNTNHFVDYPCNATSYAQVSHIYRYEYNMYGYLLNQLSCYGTNSLTSPSSGLTIGETISNQLINFVKDNRLLNYIKRYKVTDITDN